MSLTLSPDNERFLQELVARGNFSSESDALDVAVRLLRQRQAVFSKVRAGIEQAENGQLVHADEVFARLEHRALEIDRSMGFQPVMS